MFKNGAKWLCADFHLHTKSDKEFVYNGDDNSFIQTYVDKLIKEEIQVACITNHNKFDKNQYKALSKKGRQNGILFYPGVELSVKEGSNGIHCLIIFDEKQWVKGDDNNSINDFLNEVFKGIKDRENSNVKCNTDLISTIDTLKSYKKDFFIVMAHVDDRSGFFYECDGGLIKALTQKEDFHKYILGFQKSRKRDNLSNYINNWGGKEIALLEGSDCKSIDEIGKNKVFIKLGDSSFYTLQYALQDYKNRISSKKPKNTHGYIHSVQYIGGKLDGTKINFSKNLNTLIGIRGSGKSSILETVRYGLSLFPDVDAKYKNSLVENVLGSGGKIIVEAYDKNGIKYQIEKILNEETSVLDEDERMLNISINSIINNPLYFGQKDLSFAQSGYEFTLLEKLIGDKLGSELDDVTKYNNELKNKIRELVEVQSEVLSSEDLKKKNNDLKHRMKIYKEKGVDKKLEKQTAYQKDQIKLEQFITKIKEVFKLLDDSINEIEIKDLEIGTYESEFNSALFIDVEKELNTVKKLIEQIQQKNIEISKTASNLEKLNDNFKKELNFLKDEFAEIKREIQDSTLNPDSYLEQTSEIEKNEQRIKDLETKEKKISDIEIAIKTASSKRNDSLKIIFDKYQSYIEKINVSQDELKLSIKFKGDRNSFKKSMIENFRGTGLSETKISKIEKNFIDYVSILLDFFLNDGIKLRKLMTGNEYEKLSTKLLENYEKYIDIESSNLVQIKYHDKPLEQHSIGQRASALILFILTQQDNELIIIDQPEDDLDNQVIYKEVIRTIKDKKQNVQFIFATHNANIPVLGDAEIVLSTKYDDEKIYVDNGNIDNPSTQKNIVDIMEGGHEAFEKRKIIYDIWDNKISSNTNRLY